MTLLAAVVIGTEFLGPDATMSGKPRPPVKEIFKRR